jgi:chromosome segregation ATPase
MDHEYTGTERRKADGGHICTKENQIDDISDDMNNVKNDINTIKTDKVHTNELLTNIQSQLIKLEKRLYVDNGTLSIQTQLRDTASRMVALENDIKNTNSKLEDVGDQPRKYAVYTVGLISLLSTLCFIIYWIATHTTVTM